MTWITITPLSNCKFNIKMFHNVQKMGTQHEKLNKMQQSLIAKRKSEYEIP